MVAESIFWILAVFGLTNGLSTAGIFTPMWGKLKASKNYFLHQLGEMCLCPKCLGFWVGGAFSFLYRSLTDCLFVDMCIASATTWMLYAISCKLVGACRV